MIKAHTHNDHTIFNMMRLLVLATVILAFTLVQADEPQKQDDGNKHDRFDNKSLDRNSTLPQTQRCDFIGLSHLSPFVNQNFYFCSKPGWYTLLKNKWYEVIAEVNKDAVTTNVSYHTLITHLISYSIYDL